MNEAEAKLYEAVYGSPPPAARRCSFPAPNRCSVETENGWSTREWDRGEKAQYEREVLGRD